MGALAACGGRGPEPGQPGLVENAGPGVVSVMAPRAERLEAWRRLAQDLDVTRLELMTREIGLGEAVATAAALLEGKVRGRVVVDVNR